MLQSNCGLPRWGGLGERGVEYVVAALHAYGAAESPADVNSEE